MRWWRFYWRQVTRRNAATRLGAGDPASDGPGLFCQHAISQQSIVALIAVDEHANTVRFIAADGGLNAVVMFQDDVRVVTKHWRTTVNCHVTSTRLIAGISGLEATIRLVIFA